MKTASEITNERPSSDQQHPTPDSTISYVVAMNVRTFRAGARAGAGAASAGREGVCAGVEGGACSDGAPEPKLVGTDGMVNLGIAGASAEARAGSGPRSTFGKEGRCSG